MYRCYILPLKVICYLKHAKDESVLNCCSYINLVAVTKLFIKLFVKFQQIIWGFVFQMINAIS